MLEKILGFLLGGGGVAGAVTGAAKTVSILAALPLFWKFIEGHGNDVLFSVTVNQALAFGAIMFAVVQIAHGAKPRGYTGLQ